MFKDRKSNESAKTEDSSERLLRQEDATSDVNDEWLPVHQDQRGGFIRKYGFLCHVLVELLLASVIVYLVLRPVPYRWRDQITYSPASESIDYKVEKFNGGYLSGEKSVYQLDCFDCTPTDAIDQAWSELYKGHMWHKIPREQAAQLTNLTINIPGEEDHYLVGLDVFHQLHCLDNVRKALWPDRYKKSDHMGGQGMSLLDPKHVDHCIDQIRQVIQCAADVSTNWLQWDEKWKSNMATGYTYHTCRDFNRVVEWAKERTVEPFDLSIRLDDPLKSVE